MRKCCRQPQAKLLDLASHMYVPSFWSTVRWTSRRKDCSPTHTHNAIEDAFGRAALGTWHLYRYAVAPHCECHNAVLVGHNTRRPRPRSLAPNTATTARGNDLLPCRSNCLDSTEPWSCAHLNWRGRLQSGQAYATCSCWTLGTRPPCTE